MANYLGTEGLTELLTLLAKIQWHVDVEDTLPTTGEDHLLYLIPTGDSDDGIFSMYVWETDSSSFKYLGTKRIGTDIRNYYNKEEVDEKITTVEESIPTKVSQLENDSQYVDNDTLISILESYATTDVTDALSTKLDELTATEQADYADASSKIEALSNSKQDALQFYSEDTASATLNPTGNLYLNASNTISVLIGSEGGGLLSHNGGLLFGLTTSAFDITLDNNAATVSLDENDGVALSTGVGDINLNANLKAYYNRKEIATVDDIPTLSDLEGVSAVSASGTSPLTLSASKSGTSVSITGSVDLSDYYTKDDTYTKQEVDNAISSATSDSITSVLASGSGDLTLSASLSGTAVTITGSVDLSGKQDVLTAGDNITISGTTISAIDTTYSNATSSTAGLMSASDKSTLDSLSADTVTSVSASGTSPLNLSASKSGNTVTISGSVDLSDYAKSADIPTKTSELTNDSGFVVSDDIEEMTEDEVLAIWDSVFTD